MIFSQQYSILERFDLFCRSQGVKEMEEKKHDKILERFTNYIFNIFYIKIFLWYFDHI